MVRRFRRLSPWSRTLGIAVVLVAACLVGTGPTTGAAGPGTQGFKSVPPETMKGGITPEEEAAQQATLHTWLMKEMPAGVLNQPIVVSLTEQERQDLQRRQEAQGGPAVVGRTKPISEAVR
ncbi:MAG TPA: hypothetical protein VKL61_02040, partial [Candidatus Polarisedimenticolia bacterium]|nr:hypothetical protein [Candidatus Polarisedimenticolia bacterium]